MPQLVSTPLASVPGFSRLLQDYCNAQPSARAFYPLAPQGEAWQTRPALAAHGAELVELVAAQNPQPGAAASLAALRDGAGTVLTGQQVGLFGGQLLVPMKAATAVAHAGKATQAGRPHVPIFWLASEDHDFDEIDHLLIPAGRSLEKFKYAPLQPVPAGRPVGSIVLDDSILPLLDRLWQTLGDSEVMDALTRAYQPGRTFAQAFADFYAQAFAAQGLLVVDPAGRSFHRLGAPVLRAALEQADEFHVRLLERNQQLASAGYHAQVAVTAQSSLLFLLDAKSGARLSLKRVAPSATEPQGLWLSGKSYVSTDELLAVLAAEPERISPSALLRPIFQDFLFGSSRIIGGPAEVAYFAQSSVLYEAILGRQTQPALRYTATLVDPEQALLLAKHNLAPADLYHHTADSLQQQLAARALPAEGRAHLALAGSALEAELEPLLAWMRQLDEGLGSSAERSASKMRYQMNRLRRLAANFQLTRDEALGRQALALATALFPAGALQERVHGAAFAYSRHGFALNQTLSQLAQDESAAHHNVWMG